MFTQPTRLFCAQLAVVVVVVISLVNWWTESIISSPSSFGMPVRVATVPIGLRAVLGNPVPRQFKCYTANTISIVDSEYMIQDYC